MAASRTPLSTLALAAFVLMTVSYPLLYTSDLKRGVGVAGVTFFSTYLSGFFLSFLGVIHIEASERRVHGLPFAYVGVGLGSLMPFLMTFEFVK